MPKISIPLGPQQYALDTVFTGQAELTAYRYCQKRSKSVSTDNILFPKVNFIKLFWRTSYKTTPCGINNGMTADLFTIFLFVHPKIFIMPATVLWAKIRTEILANYQSSILKINWISTKISVKHKSPNYQQKDYNYGDNDFLLHMIKKFSCPCYVSIVSRGMDQCSREESNLNHELRKFASYPLNDESFILLSANIWLIANISLRILLSAYLNKQMPLEFCLNLFFLTSWL